MKILLNSVAVRFTFYYVENILKPTGKTRYQGTGEINYTAHCAYVSKGTNIQVQKFVIVNTIKIS